MEGGGWDCGMRLMAWQTGLPENGVGLLAGLHDIDVLLREGRTRGKGRCSAMARALFGSSR